MLIAQITDIHAAPNNGNLARLHRVMSWIATLGPDLLIVTGDLIDGGWHEGYRAIEVELKRAKCRFLVLPGNSDDKGAMYDCLQGTVPWIANTNNALHFSESIDGFPIVGVDSTLAGEIAGDITPHLNWLAGTLNRFSLPALIFMHHHIVPCGIAPLDKVMCRGAKAFGKSIADSPIPPIAICSGHVHRAMSAVIAGVPAYICGSVCPANPLLLDNQRIPPVTDPAALMIHDLRTGSLVSSHVSV